MDIKYFKTAWGDMKESPGWFGKLCLLSLLSFVPFLGTIVRNGYFYGWAREAAWTVRKPMPEHIISNEDGKFWRRGWFILVLGFVAAIPTALVNGIGNGMTATSAAGENVGVSMSLVIGSSSLSLIGLALSLFISLFVYIGSMRISIYDRLSAGFQLGVIWKMLKKDTGGILRILGMYIIVSLIISLIIGILFSIGFVVAMLGAVTTLVNSGYSLPAGGAMTDAQALELLAALFAVMGIPAILFALIGFFLMFLGMNFAEGLVARALGYWTMQFDVPRWQGQDAPLPFELEQAGAQLGGQAGGQPGGQAGPF